MIGRFGPRKVGESSAVGEEGNHIARLCLRLQRGCGVRGWGRDDLGTGARGRGARARRALMSPTRLLRAGMTWVERGRREGEARCRCFDRAAAVPAAPSAGCGVRGWERDGLGTGARKGARARRALMSTTRQEVTLVAGRRRRHAQAQVPRPIDSSASRHGPHRQAMGGRRSRVIAGGAIAILATALLVATAHARDCVRKRRCRPT